MSLLKEIKDLTRAPLTIIFYKKDEKILMFGFTVQSESSLMKMLEDLSIQIERPSKKLTLIYLNIKSEEVDRRTREHLEECFPGHKFN